MPFIFVGKIDNNPNKDSWWKPGVEIFSQVSGWIAGPIILALVIGKSLDSHFGTKPWIFIGLTGFAFIISSFGIVKVVSRYMKKIQEEEKNKKDL
jgi:F0F1-type ATP synthase assembly protein I